jgi:uncharacterized membrane protein YdjX (TVP38/TMEM64 family)
MDFRFALRRLWWQVGLGLPAVALMILLLAQLPLLRWLLELQTSFRSAGLTGVAAYAMMMAMLTMLMMPSLPVTIAAGIVFGTLWGSVAIVIGNALAAAGGFLVARYAARDALLRKFGHHPRFVLVDEAVRKRGWLVVFLLRFVPMPFGLTNYLYGLTAIDLGHYLLATVLAMLPGNVFFVYLGAAGSRTLAGETSRTGYEWILLVLAIGGFLGAGALISRIARQALAGNLKA